MSSTQPVLAIARRLLGSSVDRSPAGRGSLQVLPAGRRVARGGIKGSEFSWAIAFVVPYLAVFLGFIAYPVAYAIWMGSKPGLYIDLAADPLYLNTVATTLLFVGFGVNLTMFPALLLSGFFVSRSRWIQALLALYMVPWALPALPAFLAFHWMLVGQWGFLDSLLSALFGIDGPIWFNSYWLALGANIVAYIWKWMPFWTVVFLAARSAIPPELHEAADVDGATGIRRFAHVTFPLLANVYLVSTLLFTIWTFGDFTTVYFVSGGAPALSTQVLSTLGIRDAFTVGEPRLGVAVVMSALPLLIPLVIMLMRKIHTSQLQL